jgi:hypothetical protein
LIHGARAAAMGVLALLAGCEGRPARSSELARPDTLGRCMVARRTVPLPEGLGEPSGVAWSRSRPGAFWSHNDSGGDAEVFLVLPTGASAGRVRVRGTEMRDWEDMAIARCPTGNCLYLGDVGDNGRSRRTPLSLVVVPEPRVGMRVSEPATVYRAEFPEGEAEDVEAMFVLPDGSVYLITKGNDDPVRLYRWPSPLSEQGRARLQRVRELAPRPGQTGDRVTGASASPSGEWVAVRTYAQLSIFRTEALLNGGEPVARIDLMSLGEGQGEGVALADDGQVVLVSESGSRYLPGTAAMLRCGLPSRG